MLNILLSIIGIILVIYSIIIIKKDIATKQDFEENIINKDFLEQSIGNLKEYQFNDENVEVFDLLMDNKIQLSNIKQNETNNESKVEKPYNKTIAIVQDNIINSKDDGISPLHKKIMELESIGLNNEEIAKKLGRGVREIDIILKIYKNDWFDY